MEHLDEFLRIGEILIPLDYTQVEYIEASGIQYINTKLKLSATTKVELDYRTLKPTGQGTFQNLFGCAESTTQTRGGWYAYINGTSKLALCYKHSVGATPNPLSSDTIEYNTRHTFVFDTDEAYLDGRYIGTCVSGTLDSTLDIYLLARNSLDKAPSVGRLYGAKFWNNDTLVRNFIPVKKKSNNEYGMWDTVTKQFYGNIGTGSFTGNNTASSTEFASIGNIWERAIPIESTKGATTTIDNSRKCVNLLDKSTLTIGYYIDASGAIQSGSAGISSYTDAIKVEPGKQYTVSGISGYTGPGFRIHGYSSAEINSWVVQIDTFSTTKGQPYSCTFTIPNNVNYIRFSGGFPTNTNDMANEGSTALPYYPYFSPTKVMPSLKAFGGTVQEIPPKLWGRYKPVEYIESSGTQYIDTGLKANQDTKIEAKWTRDSSNSNVGWGVGYMSGASGGPTDIAMNIAITANTGDTAFWAGEVNNKNNPAIPVGTYVTNTISKDGFYYNGELKKTFGAKTFTTAGNLELFGCHAYHLIGKMAYAKIWNNNILVRNFIPVHDTVDNVYGMFDTVEEKFYGNAGTGAFTAGPEIKRVEYIESSGTQYIDTGFKATSTTIAIVKGSIVDTKASYSLFGTYGDTSRFQIVYSQTTTPAGLSIGYGTIAANLGINDTNIRTVEINGATKKAYIDGVEVYDLSGGTFSQTGYNLWLFARSAAVNYGKDKIYYCKISDGDTLVRDYVPVIVGTEYAMLDLVEWKIYRNAGTGTFIGGPEIPERLLNPYTLKSNLGNIRYGYDDGAAIPSEYERVEYIESSGAQYIDTGVKQDKLNIHTKLRPLNENTATYGLLIGGRETANSQVFLIDARNTAASNCVEYGANTNSIVENYYNKDVEIKNEGNVFYVNNAKHTLNPYTFTQQYNVYLFSCNQNNSPVIRTQNKARMYFVKMTYDGELVRSFVPVKKKSNNKYGFYDLVNSNKNLLDDSELYTGTVRTGQHYRYPTILLKAGESMTFSIQKPTGKNLYLYIIENSTDDFASMLPYTTVDQTTPYTITATNDTYVCAYFSTSDSEASVDSCKVCQAMCERGKTATVYEHSAFYGNIGTGAFTGGSVISRKIITDGSHKVSVCDIPVEYKRVEYLENSGTQYINTGITCKDSLSLSCKFQFTSSPERNRIFGGRTGTTTYGNIQAITYNSKYDIMFGNQPERLIDGLTSDTSVHTIDFKNGEQKLDNSIIATESYTFSNTIPIYLFGIYNNGSAVIGTLKVFSFVVRDGNNLVRNFIPVKKVSNNEYGMYDTVTKTFFGNAGSGSFTGGPAIEVDAFNITELLPSATSYYDTQTGTLYKDFGVKVLDGTETWEYDSSYGRGRLYIDDWLKPGGVRVQLFYGNYGTCRHHSESVSQMVTGDMYTATELNTTAFYFTYKNSTLEEFKAWLKARYDEGNPVIVVYPLAMPVTTNIPTFQIALLQKGEHFITSEAEIDVSVQAEYLGA